MESILGLAAISLATHLSRGQSSGLSKIADSECSFWLGSHRDNRIRYYPLTADGYRKMFGHAAGMATSRYGSPPFGIRCGNEHFTIGYVQKNRMIEPNLDR